MKDTLGLINNDEFDFLSLLVENNFYFDITIIKEEYLTGKNKTMFKILQQDYKTNKEIVIGNLAKYKDFDLDYFTDIYTNQPFYTNRDNKFKQLEKAIIEKYKLTQLKKIFEESKDFNVVSKKIAELEAIKEFENDYITSKDIINELTTKKNKIKLNYPLLDDVLNLSQGDLLILAGGTGTGKTAFALNLLSKLSNEYQCIYFNMEMSKNILYRRLLAIETNITLQELNDITKLDKEIKYKVNNKINEIEQREIVLINKSITSEDIKKYISNIKTKKHLVIFLDHIGLIRSLGNSLYEKMTNIAKDLRSICIDYDCTIIGLCQLSRESQKNDTIPKLQDLRDSGEIEQSARKVIMIHNKDPKAQDREHQIEIIIAKNDDGKQNVIKEFIFDRYTQKFTEKYM